MKNVATKTMNRYSVKTLREAGLEARWTKTRNGAPIIVAHDPMASSEHQRKTWWTIDWATWKTMQKVGIREGFDRHTLLGNIFSVAA